MTITLDANPSDAPCCVKIIAEDGRDLLIQTDLDWPGIATTFGWSVKDVEPAKVWASFNRFEFQMPFDAVPACSHSGQCDEDVEYWADKIERPETVTVDKLRAELKEYGAWDEDELSDDAANWRRLVWIAAGNIQDSDACEHAKTDGTVTCPDCGTAASEFIASARQYLDDNDGAEAEDPGYFNEE